MKKCGLILNPMLYYCCSSHFICFSPLSKLLWPHLVLPHGIPKSNQLLIPKSNRQKRLLFHLSFLSQILHFSCYFGCLKNMFTFCICLPSFLRFAYKPSTRDYRGTSRNRKWTLTQLHSLEIQVVPNAFSLLTPSPSQTINCPAFLLSAFDQ